MHTPGHLRGVCLHLVHGAAIKARLGQDGCCSTVVVVVVGRAAEGTENREAAACLYRALRQACVRVGACVHLVHGTRAGKEAPRVEQARWDGGTVVVVAAAAQARARLR